MAVGTNSISVLVVTRPQLYTRISVVNTLLHVKCESQKKHTTNEWWQYLIFLRTDRNFVVISYNA